MYPELSHHKLAYFVLVTGLVILTLSYFAAWPNVWMQRCVILGLMVFYTLWGALTHHKARFLTLRLFYEYLGVATLGGVILLAMTL